MSLIVVKNLNFERPNKHILKDISFEIEDGSITALVGPNGAGKTTLLRCITSLETPMSGHVVVDGVDVHDQPRRAHLSMGYLSDFFGVYENLSVRQCLTYMAWCQKISSKNLNAKIESLAADVDLTKYLDEKAGSLSRGYRQRLGVGLALVHDPKCLFLDEPASGMDPEARIHFSELMIRLKKCGVTVVVSSHILAELEDYCTDMLVIRDGEIKSHVKLSEHQEQSISTIHISLIDPQEKYFQYIQGYAGVSACESVGQDLALSFSGDMQAQSEFLQALVKKKVPVCQFTPMKKTLKSAYMDLADKKEMDRS